jgi:translation initiation factor 2 subunit 1
MESEKTGSSNAIYAVPWYPNEYPEKGTVVKVRLTRVDEMGIWVELLEYAGKEGMIPLGQYTTRKTRRIPKSVKVGKKDTALISQIDIDKGHMDLTRQGLKDEDMNIAKKRFADYKSVMNLLHFVSENLQIDFPALVCAVSYPLTDKYGDAYRALQDSYRKPEIIDRLEISDEAKKRLKQRIEKMFTPQEVRIHAIFEAEVHGPGGVDALRSALESGYDAVGPGVNLTLTVRGAPEYVASLVVLDDKPGIDMLTAVLKRIEERILAGEGRFAVTNKPKALNENDMIRLARQRTDPPHDDPDAIGLGALD